MKVLVIALLCVAAAVAAPAEKQKRDILPGDPRYGTDYHQQHHHHENEVEITRADGGYVGSYDEPQIDVQHNSFQVQKSYGPPHHQPGVPINTLNNGYLAPNNPQPLRTSPPGPIYGVPDNTAHLSQKVTTGYLQPAIDDVKRTQTSTTTYTVPIQDTKTVQHEFRAPAVNAPVTSYGTPVANEAKTTVETVRTIQDTHVQPTHVAQKTVAPTVRVTEKHVETQTVVKPESKVPTSQGVFQHSVTGFKSIPTTSGFDTSFANYPSFDTRFAKVSLPTTVYTSQPSFDTGFHGGFTGYPSFNLGGFEHHTSHVQVPQSYSVHVAKHVPVIPHTVQVQRPNYVVRVSQPVHFDYPQVVQEHVELPKTTGFVQSNFPSYEHTENFQVPSYQTQTHSFSKPLFETQQVSLDNEAVTIESPTRTSIKQTFAKEYVQPTDENGGYIY